MQRRFLETEHTTVPRCLPRLHTKEVQVPATPGEELGGWLTVSLEEGVGDGFPKGPGRTRVWVAL